MSDTPSLDALAAAAQAMLDAAATPGPWSVHERRNGRDVVDAAGNLIADDVGDDAPLIAAAPDLARALVAAAARIAAAEARRDALAEAVRDVGNLIAEHGCSCDCDCTHTTGEHTGACNPCLACRASDVVSPILRGAPADVVRASVVAEYVAAVEAHRLAGAMPSSDHPARARLRDAHRAVVAALAAVKETP